jgi:transcriptional regulator of heat shock response
MKLLASTRLDANMPQVLEEASALLSGLSHCAGLVVAPKQNMRLKHIEFVNLGPGRALVLGQRADLQDTVDKKAQALFGRQAAGGGMRRIKQSELFQIRHHVANRRRRQRQAKPARQGARPHWLSGLDISLDHVPQNLA